MAELDLPVGEGRVRSNSERRTGILGTAITCLPREARDQARSGGEGSDSGVGSGKGKRGHGSLFAAHGVASVRLRSTVGPGCMRVAVVAVLVRWRSKAMAMDGTMIRLARRCSLLR